MKKSWSSRENFHESQKKSLKLNGQRKGTFFFASRLFFSVKKKVLESEKKSLRHEDFGGSDFDSTFVQSGYY